MQIHEITLRRQLEEAMGPFGSFLSGLTGGLTDKFTDKTPGGVKQGLTGFRANPNDYGPGAKKPSAKWQDKYAALQKDPTVGSYVKSIATGWAKNPQATGQPAQGLATGGTLQRLVPSLASAAKQSNNNLTSAQIGQILSQKAPTIWNNTQDKSAAIKQLAAELRKQGVTVNDTKPATAAAAKTANVAPAAQANAPVTVAPVATTPAKAKTGGRVAGQLSQTPGAVAKRSARARGAQPDAGASAFGQMANQLTAKPTATSTGGQVVTTPTGRVHTAKSAAPVAPVVQPASDPVAAAANVMAKQKAATKPTTRIPYGQAPAAGTIAEPPIFLGGKKLDPKKPNDAKILQTLQKQGKLQEAVTTGPAADQYRAAFTKWADGQFATRVQETGTTVTMDAVRKAFPDLDTELRSALDKIVSTKGTPQQARAVEEYAKLAVAGVQAVAQMQKNKISTVNQQQNKQISNTTGNIKQALSQAGVDPTKLSQVGGQQSVNRTGNPAADSLLKLSGFKI
jgi:hypothetical protein